MFLTRVRLIAAVLLSCWATAASAQINLYVDSSRTSSGAGNSWATAYKTLNEALDIANGGVISMPYNVFVAKGTYYPPGLQTSTDRESTFAILRGGIRVYGGYPNGGGARNTVSNPTVLSGAIGNVSDSADNSYHVVVISVGGFIVSSDSAILDGFDITRGAGTGSGTTNFGSAIIHQSIGGGAAIATGRRILLRDCHFYRNFSSGNGGGAHITADSVQLINIAMSLNSVLGYSAGGAISNQASGQLRITGSSFTANRGHYGGAIFTQVSPHKLSVDNCQFTSNVGEYVGGAMHFADSVLTADFLLSNSTFTGNKVLDGGGGGAISFWWMGTPSAHAYRIRHCAFTGNKITYSGGASGGALSYVRVATLRLDTCQFVANRATEVGGAFYSSEGSAVVTGCTFQNDTAGTGGATFSSNSNPAFFNCVFTGNYANQGGAVGMTNSSISLTDCIVEGNRATGLGGGLLLNWATLTRCRVRGNWAGDKGGGLYLTAGANINNTLFSGNLSGTSGGGVALNGWLNTASLTNCTIAGNSAANGVSLYCSNTCNFTVLNSILWDGTGNTINTSLNGGTTLQHTTIQTGWSGTGNNTVNPQFVNPQPGSAAPTAGGDYSLLLCSPAINAGVTTNPAQPLDVLRNIRVGAYDRGAYEFQGVTLPAGPITGDSAVCLGSTGVLVSPSTGGSWSSSNPSVVTVSSAGVITGVALGTAVVTYVADASGCASATATKNVSVVSYVPLNPIAGPDTVCTGAPVQMSNSTPGGVWSSSNTAVATVNAAGLVTALTNGTTVISYTKGPAPCSSVVTKTVAVGVSPVVAPITGPVTVCLGTTAQFSNATPGGVWSTLSNGAMSTVSPTGVLSALNYGSGTDYIRYRVTTPLGCQTTVQKHVNMGSGPTIYGNINGADSVCVGDTIQLSIFSVTGVFYSGNSSVATVTDLGYGGCIVTGVAPGTLTVFYTATNPPACSTTKTKTIVVSPLPTLAAITGGSSVCMGSTMQLAHATPGGVWSTSSGGTRSTVSSAGLVTPVSAGTDTVRYIVSNPGACPAIASQIITIAAPQISSINGAGSLCAGASTQFSHAVTGGGWTNFNSSLGAVGSGGLYTAAAAGIDTVYYQYTSNGCAALVKRAVTVNAVPLVSSVMGVDSLCAGQTTTFTSATIGGVWTSANAPIATVSSAGIVSGVSQGLATITYAVTASGCSTSVSKTIYIKPIPAVSPITGAATLCVNATTSYSSGNTGGQWSTHSNGGISSISSSGILTGVSAGVDTIRYLVANSAGCMAVVKRVVTVNAPQLLAIAAPDSVCLGASTQLSHPASGGTWTNFSAAAGAVSMGGLYTSTAVGTDTIFYQYTSNGCPAQAKKLLRIVKPDTAAIGGGAAVCKGEFQTLTATIPGGAWTSSNAAVATVSASGQVSGVGGGVAVVSYTVPSTLGCAATSTRVVTVHAPNTTTSQNGATLTATGNQTGATYQWLNCTSSYQPIAGATGAVYTAPSDGQYAVVVSYQGCADSSACLTVSGTGMEDAIRENEVIISYISGSRLMINTGDKIAAVLRLFDAQGKLVKEAAPRDYLTVLDASDFAKGVYILHLYFSDGRVVTKVNIQ